jgi:hypothetical protein
MNEKTIGYAYTLPDIADISDQLGQSRYTSCIEMVMGYPVRDFGRWAFKSSIYRKGRALGI